MNEHLYKIIELIGASEQSIEDAIQAAIAGAGATLNHMRWFEVVETTGQIRQGRITKYQVRIKVSFIVGEAHDSHDDQVPPEPDTDPWNEGP